MDVAGVEVVMVVMVMRWKVEEDVEGGEEGMEKYGGATYHSSIFRLRTSFVMCQHYQYTRISIYVSLARKCSAFALWDSHAPAADRARIRSTSFMP